LHDESRYLEIVLRLRRYDERLHRFGLRDQHLDWDVSVKSAVQFGIREGAAGMVLLPLAVAGVAIFWAPYHVTDRISARITKENETEATGKVLVGVAVYASWLALIVTIVWAALGGRAAVIAVIVLPLLAIAGLFAVEREAAMFDTIRSWLLLRRAKHHSRAWLKQARSDIAVLLDQAYEWLSAETPAHEGAQKPG
jgi:hypothetical protein